MNRFIVFFLAQAAAQAPGNGISKSTYSCNDPLKAKAFLLKYFSMMKTSPDECSNDICTCSKSDTGDSADWDIQQGRVYVPEKSTTGEERRLQDDPGNGFGVHCVNVSGHLTTGGMSTAELEAEFTSKLGDMKEFDSFMDYSITFYTPGVAKYAAAFDKDSVPYYTTTWQDSNAQSYTSLFVQVAKTQMILELTSKKSLALGETRRAVHAAVAGERRVSARALAMIQELEEKKLLSEDSLSILSVNRAVSDATLTKVEDFYVTGMGTKKVASDSDAASGYTRNCYLWGGSKVDICFTNRPANATKGNFKVADFENMLNTVHKNVIVDYPFCGKDKWEDNHYAIDSMSPSTSQIVKYIDSNKVPVVCMSGGGSGSSGGGGVQYAFDPTGWAIQMDLDFSTSPSACSTKAQEFVRRLQPAGGGNPACSAGICAKTVVV